MWLKMGTVNTNIDSFQAKRERAFLRAVEVLNNSCLDPSAKISRFVLSTKTGEGLGVRGHGTP